MPSYKNPNAPISGSGGDVDFTNYRLNGRYFLQFAVQNDITILNGTSFNLFNSTNGMFSPNGTLTFGGDVWDQGTIIDNDYLRPDDYLDTDQPYADIETSIFVNVPCSISGSQVNTVNFELRRRTGASPTVPVAIPGREIVELVNNNVLTLSVERIPTRSAGISDNYYLYGFSPFIDNNSGSTITISGTTTIRVEVFNQYRRPLRLLA